jgi:hypothetical protein
MEVGHFSAMFRCVLATCQQPVSVIGRSYVVENSPRDEEQYTRWYKPILMDPPPRIISVPEGTPNSVRERLLDSSRLIWLDPGGAASRIRSAVESLMNSLGVVKRVRTPRRKYDRLSLHRRIMRLKDDRPEMAKQLLAIKWIGNLGTHADRLTTDDVLDAFDILSYVLEQLYERQKQHVDRLVRRRTRKKR